DDRAELRIDRRATAIVVSGQQSMGFRSEVAYQSGAGVGGSAISPGRSNVIDDIGNLAVGHSDAYSRHRCEAIPRLHPSKHDADDIFRSLRLDRAVSRQRRDDTGYAATIELMTRRAIAQISLGPIGSRSRRGSRLVGLSPGDGFEIGCDCVQI